MVIQIYTCAMYSLPVSLWPARVDDDDDDDVSSAECEGTVVVS